MILTKIELDMTRRAARMALGNCQEMHRLLNGLFDCAREDAQLLYRVRTAGRYCAVYLYSAVPIQPEKLLPFMHLAGQRDVSQWVSSMTAGKRIPFDLVTSPAKKVSQEGERNSRRRLLRTREERMAWLFRKAQAHGFCLVQVQELENEAFSGTHSTDRGGKMYWSTYHYSGVLEITDPTLFRNALMTGIGPGKAYGLGMLLLG